jgi:hypothetical protein
MRDLFFNETGVRTLAAGVHREWRAFDEKGFVKTVLARLPDLGLNERNYLIRDTLRDHLPAEASKAIALLVRSLGPETPLEGPEAYTSFYVMSMCAFVAEYGLEQPEKSLAALRDMTKRFSAEFAIRPFLDRHTKLTLATLHQLGARSRSPGAATGFRRLASAPALGLAPARFRTRPEAGPRTAGVAQGGRRTVRTPLRGQQSE